MAVRWPIIRICAAFGCGRSRIGDGVVDGVGRGIDQHEAVEAVQGHRRSRASNQVHEGGGGAERRDGGHQGVEEEELVAQGQPPRGAGQVSEDLGEAEEEVIVMVAAYGMVAFVRRVYTKDDGVIA